MKTLSKYLVREFLKLFGLFFLTFLCIYLVIDFIQKIDNFIEAEAPGSALFAFLFYKTPYIMIQMTPVACMLAAVVMFRFMEKDREIMAMKACGINVLQIARPVILLSFLMSVAVFLFSELVVPYASSKSNAIWNAEVKKKDATRLYGKTHVWYKGKDSIYWIKHFDPEKGLMEDVSIYLFDKSFRLSKKIDARKGVWTGAGWKFHEGIIQRTSAEGEYDLEPFEEIHLDLQVTPESFSKVVKEPEEMGYWELKRYARTIRREGYDATRYMVDMHVKLAFPLINLVMVLVGIPIGLAIKRGGTPVAVSLGVVACFFYLLIFGFSRSFGISGVLPAGLSAWLANAVFFFTGSYLLMRVET